jgi:aryl-alcohol dehydrogenase-like predicted oxidoreductase
MRLVGQELLMKYRPLGRTGFRASIFGLGGESALYRKSQKAVDIIERAIRLGVNYFDTAPLYHDSELNYGEVLPHNRKRMFIATKTDQRDYSNAWRQFEKSLKRLKVDHVDLLQLHHVSFPEELKVLWSPMGALKMVHEAKQQGLTRFVGITGHMDPKVLLWGIEHYPFDTILMVTNPVEVHLHSFQDELLPEAVRQGMGIIGMKVMSRGVLFNAVPNAKVLLNYAWSLPVSTAIVGVMNKEQLDRNVQIANTFMPLPEHAMDRLEDLTEPLEKTANFYRKGARDQHFPDYPNMPKSVY